MSWELAQPARATAASDGPVRLSVTEGGGSRMMRRLFITLRADLLERHPWLQAGRSYDVAFGLGENAGRLRVMPGELVKLVRLGKQVQHASPVLIIRAPEGFVRGKHGPTPCAFEVVGEALLITLPSWPAPAVAAVASPPVAPKPAVVAPVPKAPFKGLGSTGVDMLGPAGRRA